MRQFLPGPDRFLTGSGMPGERPARAVGAPMSAPKTVMFSTRTYPARAPIAAPTSLFDRARHGGSPARARAWRHFNDNAHADRRAPPGRNAGGGGQGQPDRGI